jgi:hypothetical protein
MDPRSGDKAPPKGGLTPLSEHPDMDRLEEILRALPPDRQAAFMESLSQEDTNERGTVIPLNREETPTDEHKPE